LRHDGLSCDIEWYADSLESHGGVIWNVL